MIRFFLAIALLFAVGTQVFEPHHDGVETNIPAHEVVLPQDSPWTETNNAPVFIQITAEGE